jgi:hypothetical protein
VKGARCEREYDPVIRCELLAQDACAESYSRREKMRRCISSPASRIMTSAMDDAIKGARRPSLSSRITCGACAIGIGRSAKPLAVMLTREAEICAPDAGGGDAEGEKKKSAGKKINGAIAAARDSSAPARIPILVGARRRLIPNPSRRSATRSRWAISRTSKPPARRIAITRARAARYLRRGDL